MKAFAALLGYELRQAAGSGGALLALGFFAMAASLLPLGLGPDLQLLARTGRALIWVLAALSALLSLERLFAGDAEDGTLDYYATSVLPLEAVALIKMATHWLTTGVPLILLAGLITLFYALPPQAAQPLMLSLLIGTPAISAAGAIGAALTLGLSRGGLMLPLIVLPLITPAMIFGCGAALSGAISAWYLLAAVSILAVLLSPFAIAAALRLYLAQ